MNLMEWQDLHNDNGIDEKEVYSKKTDTVNWYIDDNTDYEILIESTLYMDGSFDHEILDQYIIHLDDNDNIQDSLPAILPRKYIDKAREAMEERLGF
jgi:hypothetical protein